MADWFRKSTWTAGDAEDFERRLWRARASNRPQYIRVQAYHLFETGQSDLIGVALSLTSRVISEFPPNIQTSPAHHLSGLCHEALGDVAAALTEYRRAVEVELTIPSVRTDAYLDFGWLVSRRQVRTHYAEALALLEQFFTRVVFPIQRYRYHATTAFIADDQGQPALARAASERAIAASSETISPSRHRPHLGLVGNVRDADHQRLEVLAG